MLGNHCIHSCRKCSDAKFNNELYKDSNANICNAAYEGEILIGFDSICMNLIYNPDGYKVNTNAPDLI